MSWILFDRHTTHPLCTRGLDIALFSNRTLTLHPWGWHCSIFKLNTHPAPMGWALLYFKLNTHPAPMRWTLFYFHTGLGCIKWIWTQFTRVACHVLLHVIYMKNSNCLEFRIDCRNRYDKKILLCDARGVPLAWYWVLLYPMGGRVPQVQSSGGYPRYSPPVSDRVPLFPPALPPPERTRDQRPGLPPSPPTPLVDTQANWKCYFPPTSYAGGNNSKFMLKLKISLVIELTQGRARDRYRALAFSGEQRLVDCLFRASPQGKEVYLHYVIVSTLYMKKPFLYDFNSCK